MPWVAAVGAATGVVVFGGGTECSVAAVGAGEEEFGERSKEKEYAVNKTN